MVQVVQGDEIQADSRSSHRGGVISYLRLLEGEPNTVDNYSLVLARTPGRFSPRHRHNFEQFRYQIEGVANYGRTGKLKPGMVGYFPEGVHYGPQTQDGEEQLAMLVLQCGGASGSGYIGRDGEVTIAEELKKLGEFRDGVFFRREGVPGKKNVDAFQALWEHANQRPMVYPKPRYDAPILMHPENFSWIPVHGSPGVSTKLMGIFTERETAAEFVKVEAGATYRCQGGRNILFTISGRGTVEGQRLRRLTTLYVDQGEEVAVSADETVELLRMRLPNLAGMEMQYPPVIREAAE